MISRQAITRIHALAVLTIIMSASLAGIWFYTQSTHEGNPSKFSMEVISRPFILLKGENQIPIAIVGQDIVFLVTVEDTQNGNESGDAARALVFHVLPISLLLFFMTSIFKNTNFNKLV